MVLLQYRTEEDVIRDRDRYECVLKNYPPLNDSSILAKNAVRFLDAESVAVVAFNISGIKMNVHSWRKERGVEVEEGNEVL